MAKKNKKKSVAAAAPKSPLSTPEGILNETRKYAQVNEVNPFASSTYSTNPDGSFTRSTQFAGPLTGIFSRLGDMMDASVKQGYDYNGAPAMPSADKDWRQGITDSLYGGYKKRIDENRTQDLENFKQDLTNRGIQSNSERYAQEMSNFDRRYNDAYADAQTNAMRESGGEADRAFSQGLTARQQFIAEKDSNQSKPFSYYGSLMGSLQPMTNFGPTAQIDPAQIANQFAQREWQTEQNKLDREQQMKLASRVGGGGGGGGGGGPAYDPIALAQARQDIADRSWRMQQDYARENQPKRPSTGALLGASVLPGLAAGLGQGIINAGLFGSPSGGSTGGSGFNFKNWFK